MSFIDRIKKSTVLKCIKEVPWYSEYTVGNMAVVTKTEKYEFASEIFFEPLNFKRDKLDCFSLGNNQFEMYFIIVGENEEEEIL